MSEPYIGEIRLFAGTFAPPYWAACNGQTLNISDYELLFTVIGVTYGGNGATTFALPNLACRMPVGQGPGFPLGQLGGQEYVTLGVHQLPAHTHAVPATEGEATASTPDGHTWARWSHAPYRAGGPNASMSSAGVTSAGIGTPHENRAPYLGLTFMIALEGLYPPRP